MKSQKTIIKNLIRALWMAGTDCEQSHHPKAYQHSNSNKCPVETFIEKSIRDAREYLAQEGE